MLWDLESTPWPFDEDAVDEIYANHVLEHLGQATGTFFAIVREIYRVVRHGGEVQINVPHPLHNSFLTDPTQVRRRSEEHTSELQSLMRISYAVFCLKKNTEKRTTTNHR